MLLRPPLTATLPSDCVRREAWSAPAPAPVDFRGSAVAGVSTTAYPANDPIEDRHVVARRGGRVFAAVLDGHGGRHVSEFAHVRIADAVEEEVRHTTAETDPREVGAALVRAYERLDREYARQVEPAFRMGFGEVARVGACALTAVVTDKALVVANAGDCRAVLGRAGDSSSSSATASGLEAVPLTRDHNAREPEEKARLAREHPGEDDIVKCKAADACYVKGRLQPTRALGDLYLKYSEFNGVPGDRARGRFIPAPYTPPYITATPEIKVHAHDVRRDRFVVLASDGLWDVVSNQDAVDFVAKDQGEPSTVAQRLAAFALAREAERSLVPVERLQQLSPGARRNYHDDITVLVVFLHGHKAEQLANAANAADAANAAKSASKEQGGGLFCWLGRLLGR